MASSQSYIDNIGITGETSTRCRYLISINTLDNSQDVCFDNLKENFEWLISEGILLSEADNAIRPILVDDREFKMYLSSQLGTQIMQIAPDETSVQPQSNNDVWFLNEAKVK